MLDTAVISKTTGEISFTGTDFVLKRDLNRRVMESNSDLVKMMFDLSEEGTDISDYILKSQYAIVGINFEITVRCEGDRIKNVYLKNAREDFQDNDWNWSEKKQIVRMRTHNEWLEKENQQIKLI